MHTVAFHDHRTSDISDVVTFSAGGVPVTAAGGTAEARYRNADATERREIEREIVTRYRSELALYVRSIVPRGFEDDGFQAAIFGVLEALAKYDDDVAGPDRGKKDFFAFAKPHVLNQVQKFLDVGVSWRKRARNKHRTEGHRTMTSVDALTEDSPFLADDTPSVEDLAGDVEAVRRIREFAAKLSADDRALLFGEKKGRPGKEDARRYLILIERATAFVRGQDGYPDSLPRHSDAGRADAPAAARSVSR